MRLITILLFISVFAFGQSTDATLTTQAQVIRDETVAGANTKLRVYDMFKAMIDSKLNVLNLGTGVQTALGVNTGSAGAPILFNGAAGTPSSIALPNATGLPPTTGISGWPANSSGVLTNNGSGTLSWTAGNPYWSLASGGALTANNTMTGSFRVAFNQTGTDFNSYGGSDAYPIRIGTTSRRAIKIGNRTDDGADHGSALNIGESISTDVNVSTIARDIHVQTYYSARQSWNLFNQITAMGFDGSLTYTQDAGPGGVDNGTGNVALQLRGSNANITLPNHRFLLIQSPTGTGAGGTFAGTIQSLYGLYIEPLIKGSTVNYSIFTNTGINHFGDRQETTGSINQNNSGVAHGMTSIAPTDAFYFSNINTAGVGGANVFGLTDGDGQNVPLVLNGITGISGAFSGVACVSIRGAKKSGTSSTSIAAGERLVNFQNSSTIVGTMLNDGRLFLGGTSDPASFLHLAPGTTTVSPLKLTSGTNLTSATAGSMEYDGSNIYFSPSTTRKRFPLTNNATPSNGQIPIGNGTDYTVANITGSNGVTVTNGAGTIALALSGSILMTGRNSNAQGADVASVAGAIALGTDGNAFEITGTNAITLISNTNWQNGAQITLLFTSTATLTDGTANSGTDIGMELAGNANFVASADDIVTLVLSEIGGTQRWREVSRSVN